MRTLEASSSAATNSTMGVRAGTTDDVLVANAIEKAFSGGLWPRRHRRVGWAVWT